MALDHLLRFTSLEHQLTFWLINWLICSSYVIAYHPMSQAALEHFHGTMKSLLPKFCAESNREWDKGLPLLFAVRETPQKSLYCTADLVFRYSVHGPLHLLREKWFSHMSNPRENILNYVSSRAQTKTKLRYDNIYHLPLMTVSSSCCLLLELRSRLDFQVPKCWVVSWVKQTA